MKNIILILLIALSYFCKAQSPIVTLSYKETYETGEVNKVSQPLNDYPELYLNGCSSFELDSITISGKGNMIILIKTGGVILTSSIVDELTIDKCNPFNNDFKIAIIQDDKKVFSCNIIISGCN